MSSKPEPVIWSRDTGQRTSWYYSCQLNIIWMSNIKDICCNPRLHDLVLAGWPPCCATSSSSRRWAHAPVIHAASHFDHKKRVAWVPISMHTCGPVSIIMELRLAFLRAAGAPLSNDLCSRIEWVVTAQIARYCVTMLHIGPEDSGKSTVPESQHL